MNQTTSATIFHDFSKPASTEDRSAPFGGGAPAGQGARRGRPSGYAPRVVEMVCNSIRQYGLSDSAAAEHHGMSSTTISRWKKQFPEVAQRLLQARHGIRTHHLDLIMKHAEAENNRGLRASMWILERLFPGDYGKMSERFAHLNLEDRLLDRERRAVLDEDLLELQAARDAQRAEAEQVAAPAVKEESANHSEDASRNSRNSAEVETESGAASNNEPGRPGPDVPQDSIGSHPGRGRPESLDLGAKVEEACAASEDGSRYCRNSGEVETASA